MGRNKKTPFFPQAAERQRQPFFSTRQTNGPTVQAKLTIGKADDQYEQEADQVANRVVAKSAQSSDVQRQESDSVQRATLMSPVEDEKLGTAEARMEKDKLIQEKIQKMDDQEEGVQAKQEEEEVQTKQEEEEVQAKQEEEEVQAKQEEEEFQAKQEEEEVQAKGEQTESSGVSQKIKNSVGGGKPLSKATQVEMESAFGADFSRVRIHTNADAVELNKQLRSQAFTRGQDVFFNEGKFRPETGEGKLLLAHELTHVVQQCGRGIIGKRKKAGH